MIPQNQKITRCQPLLGTFVHVTVEALAPKGEQTLLQITNTVFKEMARIDKLMGYHHSDSELSYLNMHAYKQPVTVSKDMAKVLAFAHDLYTSSNGAFDCVVPVPYLIQEEVLPEHNVRLDSDASWHDVDIQGDCIRFARPLHIDLGGIAKGYAVDCGMAVVPPGYQVSINAGGDMSRRYWSDTTISIRVPSNNGSVDIKTPMRNGAVASSSLYKDAHTQIVCPKLKTGVSHPYTVSVFSNSCMAADALTKIAWLQSKKHPLCTDAIKTFFNGTQEVLHA